MVIGLDCMPDDILQMHCITPVPCAPRGTTADAKAPLVAHRYAQGHPVFWDSTDASLALSALCSS